MISEAIRKILDKIVNSFKNFSIYIKNVIINFLDFFKFTFTCPLPEKSTGFILYCIFIIFTISAIITVLGKISFQDFFIPIHKAITNDIFNYFSVITFFIGFYFLVRGLLYAKGAYEKQQEQLKHSEIIAAWQILGTKATGNSGKIEALETLTKYKIPLIGVDLSSETHGGLDKDGKIEGRVYLQNLNLSKDTHKYKVNLTDSKFIGADLYKANFIGCNLSNAEFQEANLWETNFNNADLTLANFNNQNSLDQVYFNEAILFNTEFKSSSLKGAKFNQAKLIVTNFNNAELMGAQFEKAIFSSPDFTGADLKQANFKKVTFKNPTLEGNSYGEYFNNIDFFPSFFRDKESFEEVLLNIEEILSNLKQKNFLKIITNLTFPKFKNAKNIDEVIFHENKEIDNLMKEKIKKYLM